MAVILQGTTPTLLFELVDDEGEIYDLSDVTAVEVTVAQQGVRELIAHSYNATIDTTNGTVEFALSEAETLALRSDRKTMAQLRLKKSNNAIVGIPAVSFSTADLLSDVMFGE